MLFKDNSCCAKRQLALSQNISVILVNKTSWRKSDIDDEDWNVHRLATSKCEYEREVAREFLNGKDFIIITFCSKQEVLLTPEYTRLCKVLAEAMKSDQGE